MIAAPNKVRYLHVTIEQQTRNWVASFVIKLNLCPFARREMDRNTIRIQVCDATEIEPALDAVITEAKLLDETADIETTLLVFPSFVSDFYDYLDFADLAESHLHLNNYEGVYQLATFHPDYCFADSAPDDPANYTNRSPFPMLHLLREASLDKAIAYYGDTSAIPDNNIACLRQLGLDGIQKLLSGTN
ncbi:DUF1415 domain-containing protein [Legionella dresdenensis]|uniref:DUF1415 domain-containing protein n=1 Tax=Legionella dresdenensis TaxID=450200 RepID=A0ABV8CER1_9GAMM